MLGVPVAAVCAAAGPGTTDRQQRWVNMETEGPPCVPLTPPAQRPEHSAFPVEIVLADVGNRLGSGWALWGTGLAWGWWESPALPSPEAL